MLMPSATYMGVDTIIEHLFNIIPLQYIELFLLKLCEKDEFHGVAIVFVVLLDYISLLSIANILSSHCLCPSLQALPHIWDTLV